MPWLRLLVNVLRAGVEHTMQKASAAHPGTRIRFLCTSHSTEVPTVTLHDNQWAFCPGGYVASQKGHFWTAIEPTKVTAMPRPVGLVRRKDFV